MLTNIKNPSRENRRQPMKRPNLPAKRQLIGTGTVFVGGGMPFACALPYPHSLAAFRMRGALFPAFACVSPYSRPPVAGKPFCCKAVKVFFPFR